MTSVARIDHVTAKAIPSAHPPGQTRERQGLSAGGSDDRPESEESRTVAVVPRQGVLDAATAPPRCRCNTDAIDGGGSPGRRMS
jgi:hypothetical protein